MAFDPSLPENSANVKAEELRNQFNGLREEAASELTAAIAETARNPSAIAPLAFTCSAAPTAAEAQAIVDFVNTMLAGLQR
jgi:hypothetical protein